jgi:alginate O-acetyltransferase complex protein AlgJ
LHEALRRQLDHMAAGSKAFAGSSGFLFFGQSVRAVLGGDLAKQKGDKNPITAIVRFRKLLAEHGVDLLFVPVPTKVEIFPDKAGTAPGKDASRLGRFVGEVVNPYERKFLLELADKGVETVDLLPALLEQAKADRAKPAGEALYQAQDTHWSTRGLELAARVIAERVRTYPWYKAVEDHKRVYRIKDASFTRHGDLHSRLPEAEKAKHQPETLLGHQVVNADGSFYEDDADSPIVLLGDSFTGVYQLMDCEHAGVSAHLARELGIAQDLVMSYGGGPNVRQKLLRRGTKALASKRLVIWMMTERDLWDFWEGWEPLGKLGK